MDKREGKFAFVEILAEPLLVRVLQLLIATLASYSKNAKRKYLLA